MAIQEDSDSFTKSVVHVVDDDKSVRRAITRLIRSAGFQVVPFESANEFLQQKPAESPSARQNHVH